MRPLVVGLFLLVIAIPGSCHGADAGSVMPQVPGRPSRGSWFVARPSEDDVLLSVSSLEWGNPDRWSFTSRYVHLYGTLDERNRGPWVRSITVTLSPGTDGGRLGLGYWGVFTPRKGARGSGIPIMGEARVVILRTWSDPLGTTAGRTFVGPEKRGSFLALVNVGAGYYRRISAGSRGTLAAIHVGVGI